MASGRTNVAGIKTNALLADYAVDADQVISAGNLVGFLNEKTVKSRLSALGAEVVFNSAVPTYVSACLIDVDKILVCYVVATVAYAIVLLVNGDVVTTGSALVVSSAVTKHTSVAKIGTNKAIVSYGLDLSANAKVLSVSGVVVTAGTALVVKTVTTTSLMGTAVSTAGTDQVIMSMIVANAAGGSFAVLLTASGMTLTAGAILQIDGYQQYTSVASYEVGIGKIVQVKGDYQFIYISSGTTLAAQAVIPYVSLPVIAKFSETISFSVEITSTGYSVYKLTVGATSMTRTFLGAVTRAMGASPNVGMSLIALTMNRLLLSYNYGTKFEDIYVPTTIAGVDLIRGTESIVITAEASTQGVMVPLSTSRILNLFATTTVGKSKAMYLKQRPEGMAISTSLSGETKKFYDWRTVL